MSSLPPLTKGQAETAIRYCFSLTKPDAQPSRRLPTTQQPLSAGESHTLGIAVQSLSQRDAIYGRVHAQVLRDNMDSQSYYRPSKQETAEYLERRLGKNIFQYAHSQTVRDGTQTSQGRTEQGQPLLSHHRKYHRISGDLPIGNPRAWHVGSHHRELARQLGGGTDLPRSRRPAGPPGCVLRLRRTGRRCALGRTRERRDRRSPLPSQWHGSSRTLRSSCGRPASCTCVALTSCKDPFGKRKKPAS